MGFFEVRCGPTFRLFVPLLPAFFFRLLLGRCTLREYRLALAESESRLGVLLDRVVLCFLAVFFDLCAERGFNDDARDLVDILFLFLFEVLFNSQRAPKLLGALKLKPALWKTDLLVFSESII